MRFSPCDMLGENGTLTETPCRKQKYEKMSRNYQTFPNLQNHAFEFKPHQVSSSIVKHHQVSSSIISYILHFDIMLLHYQPHLDIFIMNFLEFQLQQRIEIVSNSKYDQNFQMMKVSSFSSFETTQASNQV